MFAESIEIQLKDKTSLFFRPLRADDIEGIKNGFNQLSPQSRYLRFFSPVCELPDSHLKRLSDLDNFNHVGWCAIDRKDNQEIGVGVARYERFRDDATKAEFAITILDAYQNKGIGSILLQLLIQTARKNGITTFIGFVLEENKPMLQLLKPYPLKIKSESGPLLRIEIDVSHVDQDDLKILSNTMAHSR